VLDVLMSLMAALVLVYFAQCLGGAPFEMISMGNQHLYKSPAIEVYGHSRLLLPWLRVPCWFLFQSRVEKLLARAAGDWTCNLRSYFSVRCLWPLSHGDPWQLLWLLENVDLRALLFIVFCFSITRKIWNNLTWMVRGQSPSSQSVALTIRHQD